jgi:2-dehydro-3-deoxyphosphogluconate aldolase/(4S)-4-hydroxy-2-oxoglutarate aldolase
MSRREALMAKTDRLTVYRTMLDSGLVPLFYHPDVDVAQSVARAVADGGAVVLEFTNRGENALPVFAGLKSYLERESSPLILGVGSVVDAPTAALYLAHGADFVVGPVLNPEIARLCNRRKIAYIPGCATTTEISSAEELGAEIVKVFPGSTLGGPKFIRSVLAPMPWARIMPTGGVDATCENITDWIQAGAACLGMGSKLIRKDLVASQEYAAITGQVREVLSWIQEARQA